MTGQAGFTEGQNFRRAARDRMDMVTSREQAGLMVHLLPILLPRPWSCLPEMKKLWGTPSLQPPRPGMCLGKEETGVKKIIWAADLAVLTASLPPRENFIKFAQKEPPLNGYIPNSLPPFPCPKRLQLSYQNLLSFLWKGRFQGLPV